MLKKIGFIALIVGLLDYYSFAIGCAIVHSGIVCATSLGAAIISSDIGIRLFFVDGKTVKIYQNMLYILKVIVTSASYFIDRTYFKLFLITFLIEPLAEKIINKFRRRK